MRNTLKLVLALLMSAFPLSTQTTQSSSSGAAEGPRTVTFCELAKDPPVYNHELIRLTAFATHGFENFSLSEPNCPALSPLFSVWVMYGGKAESNTVYCCPGEAERETRSESLTVEGLQVPLFNDLVFQRFVDLLKKEPDTTVRVTVVGRFFSGAKQTFGGSTSWGGFGHFGCCSRFAIQRVEGFEPHTRSDVDYTAEAGWYEKEGCRSGSLRYLKHVSLADGEGTAEQAIAEQRTVDSGERAWAFGDPQRVAIESLRPFYKDRVPVLRNVRKTPVRQVFRWRDGRKSIIVVVTRPYWLSFYTNSGSVAWVSTTIKEADCH
jgi:hypothetical protein